MKQLIFEEYLQPDMRYQEENDIVITSVIKQLSRCRFEVTGDLCKVEILLNNEKTTIIFSNKIDKKKMLGLAKSIFITEPSLDLFCNKISISNEPLFTFLKKYQQEYYKLGTEFENEYWYKFYSKTKIEDGMRRLYQAGWIDYENQLENESIIYDELGISGLWAMPYNSLLDHFDENHAKLFGDKLFVLKTVPDCRYLKDRMELIGDRFEVVQKYDLNDINDIGRLINHLIEVDKSKYETIIENKNITIENLNNKNMKLNDNLEYLKNAMTQSKLLFFLIGIMCAIIIRSILMN